MSDGPLFRLPAEIAKADNLPTSPTIAVEVVRIADNPQSCAEDLGTVIQYDPALAARLLRTVNSVSYGLPRAVDSIPRACALLGFERTKTLAMGFAVVEAIPGVSSGSGLDLHEYWLRSALTATCAELFARRVQREVADVAFIDGLLSEIGRLVLADCLPEAYNPLLEKEKWPSPAAERERLGFTSAELTGGLLTEWGMPDEIVLPIVFRDQPDQLPEDTSVGVIRLCRILAAAQVLADVWARGGVDSDERDINWAGSAAAHYLRLPPAEFVEVVRALKKRCESGGIFDTVAPPGTVNVGAIERDAQLRLEGVLEAGGGDGTLTDLVRSAVA